MKIAVIQASSQKEKNEILYQSVIQAEEDKNCEVVNFGVYPEEDASYSYVQTAFMISLLLESGAVDFVVTGCSSGQGMMLACNSLPGVLCGYIETPSDAYLFGRINDGNAVSFPLGLNYGWAGEINLQSTMKSLFAEPFGIGYPAGDSERKRADTREWKKMNALTKRSMAEILPQMDSAFVKSALTRKKVLQYVLDFGTNRNLVEVLKMYL